MPVIDDMCLLKDPCLKKESRHKKKRQMPLLRRAGPEKKWIRSGVTEWKRLWVGGNEGQTVEGTGFYEALRMKGKNWQIEMKPLFRKEPIKKGTAANGWGRGV